MFIFAGCITMLWSFFVLVLLDADPVSAKSLNPLSNKIATGQRIRGLVVSELSNKQKTS